MKIKSETVRMRYAMTPCTGEGKRKGAGKYGNVQKGKGLRGGMREGSSRKQRDNLKSWKR